MRVALITGAGSGIGRSIALRLAGQGMRVGLVGRSLPRLEAVAAEVEPVGVCLAADLAVDEDVQALAAAVKGELGRLDVLVHSAGLFAYGAFGEAPIEDLDRQYRVNLRAPWLLTTLLLPMLRASQGQVVFVNSSAGLAAGVANGQYAATKAGLKAAADSLRQAVNPDGVRVLSVYPGRTDSPMQAGVHRAEGRESDPRQLLAPGDVAEVVAAALNLPGSAEVTDLNVRPLRAVNHAVRG
jgi:NAD(P)-dependent dehydrogenase (short-subunit alcohol dehydrogenase family)